MIKNFSFYRNILNVICVFAVGLLEVGCPSNNLETGLPYNASKNGNWTNGSLPAAAFLTPNGTNIELNTEDLKSIDIDSLSSKEIKELAASKDSKKSLREFTKEQTNRLKSEQLSELVDLSLSEQFHAITGDQFDILLGNKVKMPEFICNIFKHRQKRYERRYRERSHEKMKQLLNLMSGHSERQPTDSIVFTKDTVKKMPSEEIQKLNSFNCRELFLLADVLSPEQIEAIPLKHMPFFWSFPVLTNQQIQAITPDQIKLLSGPQLDVISDKQFEELTPEQKKALNNEKQIKEMPLSVLLKLDNDPILDGVISSSKPEDISGFLSFKAARLALYFNELNEQQIQAIGPDQVKFFSTKAMEKINAKKIQYLIEDAIGALRQEQVGSISEAAVLGLSSRQIIALGQNIRWLSVKAQKSLKPEQIAALNSHQAAVLDPKRFQYFSDDQVGAFTEAFTESQVRNITAEAMKGLKIGQIKVLSPAQTAALNAKGFQYFSAEQLGAFTPVAIANLTPMQVRYIRAEAMKGLITDQIKQLSPIQTPYLNRKAFKYFSAEQLGAFTPEAFGALTELQIHHITGDAAHGLTTPQKEALGPKIGALSGGYFRIHKVVELKLLRKWDKSKKTVMKSYYGGVLVEMTPAEIRNSSPELVKRFDPAGFNSFSAEQLGAFTKEATIAFTEEQVKNISRWAVKGLRTDQIQALGVKIGKLSVRGWGAQTRFTPIQIGAMSNQQVLYLDKVAFQYFSVDQLRAFTPEATAAFTESQVSNITAEAMKGLSVQQIKELSPTQAAALNAKGFQYFSADQVGAFTQAAKEAFTKKQGDCLKLRDLYSLKGLSSPSRFSSAKHIGMLPLINIEKLTESQVRNITAEAMEGLKIGQIAVLSPVQAAALNAEGFQFFSVDQVGAFTPSATAAFTESQVRNITAEAVRSLKEEQIKVFSFNQLRNFKIDSRQAFLADHSAIMTDEQKQACGTNCSFFRLSTH